MKSKNVLDVPKIQKMIHDKHKEFIDEVGCMPIKITADRQLVLTRIYSRLSQILCCFKTEGVIDRFITCALPESFYSHKGFHVTKKGYERSIFIWTDGNDIIFTDSSFLIKDGFANLYYKTFRDIDIDSYNWEEFTEVLLSYIHMVIYERQIAYEKTIWKEKNDGSDQRK